MKWKNAFVLAAFLLSLILGANEVFAHCDGMDGPVVKAAQKALETGNVKLVLIWVQKKDEAEIVKAFEKTLAVRQLSPAAKELADMYFFETLVRLHRAGEGAPYTGLKPAGTKLEPAVAAADKALETGSVDELMKLMTNDVTTGMHRLFFHAIEKKKYADSDIEAGREFVAAYVQFVHYVERLHLDATGHAAHESESNGAGVENIHKH